MDDARLGERKGRNSFRWHNGDFSSRLVKRDLVMVERWLIEQTHDGSRQNFYWKLLKSSILLLSLLVDEDTAHSFLPIIVDGLQGRTVPSLVITRSICDQRRIVIRYPTYIYISMQTHPMCTQAQPEFISTAGKILPQILLTRYWTVVS